MEFSFSVLQHVARFHPFALFDGFKGIAGMTAAATKRVEGEGEVIKG